VYATIYTTVADLGYIAGSFIKDEWRQYIIADFQA
jgi:hypothetical protein